MTDNITNVIAWFSMIAASIVFLAAVIDLVTTWSGRQKATNAVAAGSEKVKDIAEATPGSDKAKEYAGIDFKGSWEALGSLATALKDLDRSSRLFMLSLAFLAVAGATVGLQAIGTGLAGIGS
ncbi:hypothetical protein [Leifsonia sp. Le1]|uniref:hypothetical protein n=1 Tax=Leifsonia sp. Le1 TaxID=3404918 RepID=UPI003EBC6488